MATKFSEIYERAIWKVRDYDSLVRTPQSSEAMYFHLLIGAITDVQHYTPTALTYKEIVDDEEADPPTSGGRRRRRQRPEPELEEEPEEPVKDYIFDEELSAELQELLALGVAVKWLEPHFLNSDALKKAIYNKDYKDFGLDADKIATIYHTLRRLFEGKAKTMSFRYSNFDRLTAGRG